MMKLRCECDIPNVISFAERFPVSDEARAILVEEDAALDALEA